MIWKEKTRVPATDYGIDDRKYYSGMSSILYLTVPNYQKTFKEWLEPLKIVADYNLGCGLRNLSVTPLSGTYSDYIRYTNNPRPKFNECHHYYVKGFNFPFYHLYLDGSETSGTAFKQIFTRVPSSGNQALVPKLYSVDHYELDNARRRAWWSLQPKFESEFSFLNFVYEMKDFKGLVKMLGKLPSVFTKKVKDTSVNLAYWAGLVKRSGGSTTLTDPTKILASGWLAYSFAIKPLINDVTEILRIFKDTIDGAQEEFNSRGMNSQTSHYTEYLCDKQIGTWSATDPPRFTGSLQQAKFTATLAYKYTYKMREGYEKIAKYLGMNLTAGVIWNALPWTFLLDYFLKIGDVIQSMQVDRNVKLELLHYSESIKLLSHHGIALNTSAQKVCKLWAPTNVFGKKEDIGVIPYSGFASVCYDRVEREPLIGVPLPRFSKPSNTQIGNMAALIRTMMK